MTLSPGDDRPTLKRVTKGEIHEGRLLITKPHVDASQDGLAERNAGAAKQRRQQRNSRGGRHVSQPHGAAALVITGWWMVV
jgi:hypothetical protein